MASALKGILKTIGPEDWTEKPSQMIRLMGSRKPGIKQQKKKKKKSFSDKEILEEGGKGPTLDQGWGVGEGEAGLEGFQGEGGTGVAVHDPKQNRGGWQALTVGANAGDSHGDDQGLGPIEVPNETRPSLDVGDQNGPDHHLLADRTRIRASARGARAIGAGAGARGD